MMNGSVSKLYMITLILGCTLIGVAQSESDTQRAMEKNKGKVIDYFDVYDAELRSVFKQLSQYSGIDIVLGENVDGKVTLSTRDKSWQELMHIVCRIFNLKPIDEGTYIFVVTESEFQKRKLDNAKNLQLTETTGLLKRQVIKLNNTSAEEIKESLQHLLSDRGKMTIVKHNNSILVYDTEENIQQIQDMIYQLDVETGQVSISCKIIEVSSGAMQNMGIHWGYTDADLDIEANHIPQKEGFIPNALERISYGILSGDNLNVALEYLFEDNKAEIVAQPSITTLDNKEASIFMGQQIPLKFVDEAGNTVVQLINAGTSLLVTPHIAGNGRILMKLNPKKESYQLQDGLPIISQQSAETNVVVGNGETVVIAGLTSNKKHEAESGIPFLKDIPLLGHIFKKSKTAKDKKELIIFVTPRIIESGRNAVSGTIPEDTPQDSEETSIWE